MGDSTHIGYYDFCKGVAIVMVVAIHTCSGFDFTSIEGNIRIVLRLLMNSAVPIFLAISGFFLSKKNLKITNDYISFWKAQIPKVYIPMIFWSFPLFFISILCNDANLIKSIVKLFLGGYSIYYFIILIIQCYLLFPLIKSNNILCLLISFVLTALSWCAIIYILPSLPLVLYAGIFVSWIFYFVLGVVLSNTKNKYSVLFPILLIFVGLILQYCESLYLFDLGRLSLGQKVSSLVANSGVVLFMFSDRVIYYYKSNIIVRIFEFLGNNSFGIYLIHCYFVSLFSIVIDIDIWSVKFLLVICLTLVFILIIKEIVPKSIRTRLLGFR